MQLLHKNWNLSVWSLIHCRPKEEENTNLSQYWQR